MDPSQEDRKENLNQTKRYSILKYGSDEINLEENTKFRKFRRVSFANKVDYKTLDESSKTRPPNTGVRACFKEEPKGNGGNTSQDGHQSDKPALTDVSNISPSPNNESNFEHTKDKPNMDEVEMELDDDESIAINEQSSINQTKMYNPIDYSMLRVGELPEESQDRSQTACLSDASMDPLPARPNPCSISIGVDMTHSIVVDSSRHVSNFDKSELTIGKKVETNMTYTLVEKTVYEPTCLGELELEENENAIDRARLKPNESVVRPNMNMTLEKIPAHSFMANRTLETSSRSFMMDANEPPLKSHYQPALNISTNMSLTTLKLNSSQFQPLLNQSIPANIPPLPMSTQQFVGQDVKGIIKAMGRLQASSPGDEVSGDEFYEALKSKLEDLRERTEAMAARKRDAVKNAKTRYESELASVKTLRQEKNEWMVRLDKRRNDLERLRTDAIKNGHRGAFDFNQAYADSILNDLNELRQKNSTIQKEYEEKRRTFETLKDTVENTSEVLKSLQKGQNEKEELKNLFEKLFSETNLGFRLGYYDNDTIVALFLFDLIQLEIKGTNIVKDLRSQTTDTLHKYLNYPLDQVNMRSNIDANTNTFASQYKSINMHPSNIFRGGKQIPVYLRYCVELVLGEVGTGNVMLSNKKIKYVKDIPSFISHVNLAARMAANLARDFEYFATLTTETPVKCDFEFKNFMVHLLLISTPDVCLYKLKLKVKPGCYYQQAIPFWIEKADGEMYEPNFQRIRSLIEDQCFENGSIKTYLDRLMKL